MNAAAPKWVRLFPDKGTGRDGDLMTASDWNASCACVGGRVMVANNLNTGKDKAGPKWRPPFVYVLV